ncbi:hypothetical protein, partial [uncultured Spirosoma sp.]|uniref:hypothetical protein n=1 Tax=uncultured Spirosoma sp. TaxID=278208 RepID=UPI002586268A
DELGKPAFSLTGPTNPVRGSQISVSFFGPYSENLQWYTPPYYATILSTHYAYGATLKLSGNPGYGYVTATSSSPCGSLTKWFEWSAQ